MSKHILVTGGCGYIGSHTIVELIQAGYEVSSVDALFNSKVDVLDIIFNLTGKRIINYCVDLANAHAAQAFFKEHHQFDGIIHFAAFKAVGESVEKPLLYYHNNINACIQVLQACLDYNIPKFIFSSSCTVYGEVETECVTEETICNIANSPYGRTKQICEELIYASLRNATSCSALSLRYFNPAGAHVSGLMGEDPRNPALNLIPIITETAIGKRNSMTVYGKDYPTRDGSCIRDYIHVSDLATAHVQALDYLFEQKAAPRFDVINLGTGRGTTVLEAIQAFEKSTGQILSYDITGRRPGDLSAIYANFDKAKKLLNWEPKMGIYEIMETAWKWEKNR